MSPPIRPVCSPRACSPIFPHRPSSARPSWRALLESPGPRFGTSGVHTIPTSPWRRWQARAIFEEQGIRVSVLDTGLFKIPLPPDTPEGRRKLDEQWRLLDAAMERAAVFGTRKIRIFTFMLEKGEKPSAKSYDRIDDLLREAARRARPGRFLLAVEDIGAGHFSNAAESAELLKR